MRTQMEEDIDVVRNHLGEVMVELEGWGPRATGVPARLRENIRPLAIGTVALAAAGLGLWWARAQSRRTIVERALAHLPTAVRPAGKSRQLLNDVRKRMVLARRPEPSHPLRSLFYKLSSASLVAAASVVARHVAAHLVEKQWRKSATPSASATNPDNNLTANFGR
jgi:hypothetical protein